MVDGHPIYFRGFRILNAVIEYLLEEKGMRDADNVIMTGCSGERPIQIVKVVLSLTLNFGGGRVVVL